MKLKEIAQNQMLSSKSKLPCFLQEKKIDIQCVLTTVYFWMIMTIKCLKSIDPNIV